ncbi:MAG: hypothetical protein MUF64_08300 [Polyangiaceae bacterium]|nr:hypothetical protein [Polyangiaceae bacterium]
MSFYAAPVALAKAHSALRLVASLVLRDDTTCVADLAEAFGVSRSRAYQLLDQALAALCPHPPGPVVGHRDLAHAHARIAQLEAENTSLRRDLGQAHEHLDRCVEVTERKLDRLNLVMAHHKVSVDATAEILRLAFDGRARGPSWLHERRQQLGRVARGLLDQARAQVCGTLRVVAADDIFLHRLPVKVVMEPRSLAVLQVMRWPWHAGEDWMLFLEEFPDLDLVVADLGTDLVAATSARNVLHMADFFHEKRWWADHVLKPLSRHEQQLAVDARQALERATRVKGPGRRLAPARVDDVEGQRAHAEAQFFLAAEAVDDLMSLYQPLCPATRQVWSARQVHLTMARAEGLLAQVQGPVGETARGHLARHGWKYEAHRGLLDHLDVQLRVGTVWTRDQVLAEVVHLDQVTRRAERATDGAVEAWRRVRSLDKKLRRACTNLAQVRAQLQEYREVPCRSSSAVESFNNRVRVMQYVHRRVSDELLALEALAWNLSERREGRLRGKRPYDELGVDVGQANEAWYDVVLNAERLAA